MRVIAFLALLFGFIGQMLLDGQVFTHAVFGIFCGLAAIFGGWRSARKDFSQEGRRWLGRIMAGLGLVLAVFCAIQLPSAYGRQEKSNRLAESAREAKEAGNATEAAPINGPTNSPNSMEDRYNEIQQQLDGTNRLSEVEMQREAQQDLAQIIGMGLGIRAAQDFAGRFPNARVQTFQMGYFVTTNTVWSQIAYRLPGQDNLLEDEFGYRRLPGTTNWTLIRNDN